MPAPDPAVLERQMYVNMVLGGVDDPSYSLAELRDMTGGGANTAKSVSSSRSSLAEDVTDQVVADISSPLLTIEEVSNSVILDPVSISATRIIPVYTAFYTSVINQISLCFGASVAASDTDYWTVELYRYRNGSRRPIATKTTKTVSSGGEGITAFVDWNFDLVALNFNNFVKGDILVVKVIPTGAPAALANPVITLRAQPSDALADASVDIVVDTFTRADSAVSLGTSETGQPWVQVNNVYGISSGQVYSPNATQNERWVIDTGYSDCTVEVKIAAIAAGGSLGLCLRMAADGLTGFNLNQTNIFQYTSPSTNTSLGTFSQTFVAGDTMRVKMEGQIITVYRQAGSVGDFVQVLQINSTWNQNETRHGLRSTSNAGLANRMDNFKVTLT